MHARAAARVLLTVGFLAASVAYSSWLAERTILDPAATRGAASALLSTTAVRTSLVSEVRAALEPSLGAAAHDPRVTTALDRAIVDPRLVGAFQDAIVAVHRHVLSDHGAPVTLDRTAVMAAVDDAFARVAPDLAAKVRASKAVKISLGGSDLPRVGNAARAVRTVGNLALTASIALVGGALLLARDRRTIRHAGRRLAMLALPAALVFVVAPHVLRAMSTSTASSVAAAILGEYAPRVLPSMVLLTVTGVLTWLLAIVAPAAFASAAVEAPSRRAPLAPAAPPSQPAMVTAETFRPAARAADELYL